VAPLLRLRRAKKKGGASSPGNKINDNRPKPDDFSLLQCGTATGFHFTKTNSFSYRETEDSTN